jgi:hypothetical protein
MMKEILLLSLLLLSISLSPLSNIINREECGVKEDVVTKIEKNMLRWFGHVERMDERRLTKEICKADLGGIAGRGRPRRNIS